MSVQVTPSDIAVSWSLGIMTSSRALKPVALVLLLLLSTWSGWTVPGDDLSSADDDGWSPTFFEVQPDTYHTLAGTYDHAVQMDDRTALADSRLGRFSDEGLLIDRPLPESMLTPRADLRLVIVDLEMPLTMAREELGAVQGMIVREFIAPSGLLLQAPPAAFDALDGMAAVRSIHAVPAGMFVDDALLDVLLLTGGEAALQGAEMRLEGWRDVHGPLAAVDLQHGQHRVHQDLSDVASVALDDPQAVDDGRWRGDLATTDLLSLALQPSVMWLGPEPTFAIANDQARQHMKVSNVANGFTTSLNGSGIIVAVADSGLDADHGDFGTRVLSNADVVGDGSTADKHSGHGTHVACTVLGDGSRGGYAGVAPQAELIFQAMENDNNGQFLSPSLNYILNQAYSQGARIHTNSWGSSQTSDQGKYTSSAEDIDDRTAAYDRTHANQEGLLVLFAAGNDGPGTGTVGAPSTAKNTLTVGNHQNRYSGAPDTMMSGSSRGPTDDGRIKPDVVAPGGYVRSCRAQEAGDTGSATWSNQYYLEYTGTSMATPNAAGAAALVREYLVEIALRPEPQGALIKALLILGAEDMGTRNIPNDDEGWGRVNLRDTLAPTGGRGIWVDDRSLLSSTGQSKSYVFNVSASSSPFKVVLAWSDERGSRFSSTQLVNDLDLEVTSPDGITYLGNVFSNGRSIQAGSRDTLNNVEVVLIDAAQQGIWEVKVKDTNHAGSRSQPYSIAVSGQGVNDLRPDPLMVPSSFTMDVSIPQVGDPVSITSEVMNMGNVKADAVDVALLVDGTELDRTTVDLFPGSIRSLPWTWTPTVAGTSEVIIRVDPEDVIDEVQENNNDLIIEVNVSAPGVKVSAVSPELRLTSSTQTTSSWNITLTNTALIGTNASLSAEAPIRISDGFAPGWYVGLTLANFTLEGRGEDFVTVTAVHQARPAPGTYRIPLTGLDVDNGVSYPYNLTLTVPSLPEARFTLDYSVVPVHPLETTTFAFTLTNDGNGPIGYDLFLESPTGWAAGFDNLGSEPGASSGSTGLMDKHAARGINVTVVPPSVKTVAGSERTITVIAISQTDPPVSTSLEIPMEVVEVRDVGISLESSLPTLRPDASVGLFLSLENRGNVNLNLTPSFLLPSGWSVSTAVEPISLGWTDTIDVVYTLVGDGSGQSGTLEVRFSDDQGRFTWTAPLDVRQLPDPTLDFNRLLLEDGSEYPTSFGSGSHPTGETLRFEWLVGNGGEASWSPSVQLDLDAGLFGSCDDPGAVGVGEFLIVRCDVVLPPSLPANTEPSFSVVLTGDGFERRDDVTMLVAADPRLDASLDGITPATATEVGTVTWTLANTGNTPIDERLTFDVAKGWEISIDGASTVTLDPGATRVLRVTYTSTLGGEAPLTLEVDNVRLEGDITATATSPRAVAEEGQGAGALTAVVGAAVVLLVVAGVLVLRQVGGKKEAALAPKLPLPMPALAAATAPPVAAAPAPAPVAQPPPAREAVATAPCWACRGTITGPMLGCPTCGARFHLPGTPDCHLPETCPKCGTPRAQFLNA